MNVCFPDAARDRYALKTRTKRSNPGEYERREPRAAHCSDGSGRVVRRPECATRSVDAGRFRVDRTTFPSCPVFLQTFTGVLQANGNRLPIAGLRSVHDGPPPRTHVVSNRLYGHTRRRIDGFGLQSRARGGIPPQRRSESA